MYSIYVDPRESIVNCFSIIIYQCLKGSIVRLDSSYNLLGPPHPKKNNMPTSNWPLHIQLPTPMVANSDNHLHPRTTLRLTLCLFRNIYVFNDVVNLVEANKATISYWLLLHLCIWKCGVNNTLRWTWTSMWIVMCSGIEYNSEVE